MDGNNGRKGWKYEWNEKNDGRQSLKPVVYFKPLETEKYAP